MSKTAFLPAHACWILSTCFLLTRITADGAVNNLDVPPNAGCACPGDLLTYTCTIISGGNTIWTGSAFNCPMSSDEIILRHSQFAGAGSRGDCTEQALRAQSLGVENGNCYRSELNATVSTSLNGRSIRCEHNNNTGTRLIAESVLNVISTANQYPAPTNVRLSALGTGREIMFNWTAICSTAQFLVESNCGLCPTSTNASAVTCTSFQLPTDSNDTMCSVSVTGVACGMTSDLSTTAVIRVPGVPSVQNIIPTYSNESRMLTKVELNAEIQSEVVSGDISGPVLNYIPSFLSSSGASHSTSVSAQPDEGPFNYTVDVPSELCTSAVSVGVSMSAGNAVGRGFPSGTESVDCVNNFIRVNFYPQNSTITCTFIDRLDATEKSCRIDYGLRDKGLTNSSQRSTSDNQNVVSLYLMNLDDGQYRYVIQASSNVTTVRVEGDFTKESPSEESNNIIIVATIVPVVIILVIATLILVTVCVCLVPSRTPGGVVSVGYHSFNHSKKDLHKLLQLKKIIGRELKVYKVNEDCALEDIAKEKCKGGKYERGCMFYELTDKNKDNVYKGQDIILQIKSTEELFSPQVESSVLQSEGLLGEGVSKPNYGDEYQVFVQCMGSGKRHLQAGTYVIHEEPEHTQSLKQKGATSSTNLDICGDKKQPLILPAPENYFLTEQVGTEVTTLPQLWNARGLDANKLNVFLELDNAQLKQKPGTVRDVLLMDKVTGDLFSDPLALSKVKEGKEKEIDSKWRVLVLGDYSKVTLQPGMWVAYENREFIYGSKFRAIEVIEEDNVRLSDFISRKIGTVACGEVFYEFREGDVEDLLYCRKAMAVTDAVVKQLFKEDSSAPSIRWSPEATIATFYGSLSSAPGEKIRSPSTKSSNLKFFIQSTSQGARCLKKGTVVLYKCEVDHSNKHGTSVNKCEAAANGHGNVKTS